MNLQWGSFWRRGFGNVHSLPWHLEAWSQQGRGAVGGRQPRSDKIEGVAQEEDGTGVVLHAQGSEHPLDTLLLQVSCFILSQGPLPWLLSSSNFRAMWPKLDLQSFPESLSLPYRLGSTATFQVKWWKTKNLTGSLSHFCMTQLLPILAAHCSWIQSICTFSWLAQDHRALQTMHSQSSFANSFLDM